MRALLETLNAVPSAKLMLSLPSAPVETRSPALACPISPAGKFACTTTLAACSIRAVPSALITLPIALASSVAGCGDDGLVCAQLEPAGTPAAMHSAASKVAVRKRFMAFLDPKKPKAQYEYRVCRFGAMRRPSR